jgi:hypothetical protein
MPPPSQSAQCGDDKMGSTTEHEISHSAKAPFEMTAIHNRWGLGKVAAPPQLFPIPPFHKQRRVISNEVRNLIPSLNQGKYKRVIERSETG